MRSTRGEESSRSSRSGGPARSSAAGRPEATTPSAIERVAFELFAQQGFERTTLQAIADAVGVGRRTLFRYYGSKNDIPWGQFEQTLTRFRQLLADMPEDMPVADAVHQGVMEFNRFGPGAAPTHRERMSLILDTPALQAHSMLKYADWRAVIAEFVAERLGMRPDDLRPRVVAHVSLALSLSAYEAWLADPSAELIDLLDASMGQLREHLAG